MTTEQSWFTIEGIDTIDSPALVLYKDRVQQNIAGAKSLVNNVDRLRPHVKTNKMAEVCTMMMYEGISKFKCATIAEAEMLGQIGANDILLAYQPVGPKILRLIDVSRSFLYSHYSCLVDNSASAKEISKAAVENYMTLDLYIDLNVGMNRSGIIPENAMALADEIVSLPNVTLYGLHAYDGHIDDADLGERKKKTDAAFKKVFELRKALKEKLGRATPVVAGGSPTFPVHAANESVECSPGTFIFWDWNYKHEFPDQPFDYAALVLCRVVSIIDSTTLCIDLGHKSVAAEKPLPRVHFLNAPDAVPKSHSEEHMVLTVPDSSRYAIGDVLYGVPSHICPTVALHERATVVERNKVIGEWDVTARNKKLTM